MARFVRALILQSLGRVGECEAELDISLAAARTAADGRRITSVLGAAALAALWGPSSVARAGGRCLDIVRLLRITSASPMVEATSVRCQGVLEAMRGRYEQARELIDRSRETAEELGLRQGVLETEEFAGLVELFAGDPALAETHLRVAYDGLAEMGARASAGRAGALLAKSVLMQGRVEEAEKLATDSDALAGQALQTAIGSRAALGEAAARDGRHDEALALAEEAVSIAACTDLLIDHANAVAGLSTVQRLAGDAELSAGSRAKATSLFEAKGAIVTQGRPEPTPPTPDADELTGDSHSEEAFEAVDEASETDASDVKTAAEVRVGGPVSRTLAEQAIDHLFSALVAGEWEQVAGCFREDHLVESSRTLGSPRPGPRRCGRHDDGRARVGRGGHCSRRGGHSWRTVRSLHSQVRRRQGLPASVVDVVRSR